MKTKIFTFLFSTLLLFSCGSNYDAEFAEVKMEAIPYETQLLTHEKEIDPQNNSIKNNDYQNLIKAAFVSSIYSKNTVGFDSLDLELTNKSNKTSSNIFNYWKAYLSFYKCLAQDLNGNASAAETTLTKGIALLEGLKNKNSEDYALLAQLCNFQMKYTDETTKIIAQSKLCKKYTTFSIELDPNNPRPYYVQGSLDFYTPVQYGGGKTLEKDFLKAISLPAQKNPNPLMPSWGHEETYELLIKYYLRENKKDVAKKYFKEAKLKFPDNYQINSLASELID